MRFRQVLFAIVSSWFACTTWLVDAGFSADGDPVVDALHNPAIDLTRDGQGKVVSVRFRGECNDLALKALKGLPELQVLSLERVTLTQASCEQLSALNRLKVLCVTHSDTEWRSIKTFDFLSRAVTIDLSHNSRLTDEELAKMLPVLEHVMSLDLSHTSITSRSFIALGALPHLSDLALCGIKVGTLQTSSLSTLPTLAALAPAKSLKLLDISECGLFTDADIVLLKPVRSLRSLTLEPIALQAVTTRGFLELKEACPQLDIARQCLRLTRMPFEVDVDGAIVAILTTDVRLVESLYLMQEIPSLRVLRTRVDVPQDLQRCARIASLLRLELSITNRQITVQALKPLATLDQLEELDITSGQVSREWAEPLAAIPNLNVITLPRSPESSPLEKRLREMRPSLICQQH